MSDSPANLVLFLSGDLMFASRVRGAADRAELQFKFSGNLPAGELDSVAYVIIDLSTRSKLIPDVVDEVAARCPQAKLIAYGPHVQVSQLKAAREAGVPTVMTRGQFDAALASLFTQR
ncbi:MAG: histidine kinase [Novipirellula sp. JB048]